MCVLDNQLNNSYIEHLLSGKSLPLSYTTWITQQSSITQNQLSVQVARSCSRLKKWFFTLYNPPATPGIFDKQCISFYHPMSIVATELGYSSSKELQIQLQLGSSLYPEYAVKSLNESYKILRQSLNLPDHRLHSLSIDFRQYKKNHFIYCQNFERVQDSAWTGINTKAGQLLIVKLDALDKSVATGISTNIAQSMFITLESENILEIRDSGCTVYD